MNRIRTGIDGGYALGLVLVKVQLKRRLEDPSEMTYHVVLTCLAEYCGTRDDSLSWNLSRVKQCGAIQGDSIE